MENVKTIAFYSVSGGSHAELVAEPCFLQHSVGSGVPATDSGPPAGSRAQPSGGVGVGSFVSRKLET